MQPLRKILFAADFSENSKDAFRAACSVAIENKTRIFVLHVVEPNWVPEEPAYFGQQAVQFHAGAPDKAHHQAIVQKMHEVFAPDHSIDVEYQTREGDASQEVLRMAEEIGCDLIVMGTHGRKGLTGLLAGSVAIAVLRGAHCPVLALRSAERPRESKEIRVILHPTDFSVDSDAALRVARWLARDHRARLIVLHVATLEILTDGTGAAEVDPRVYRGALEDVRRRIDGPDLKHPVEILLRRGFAPKGIIETAEEVGADLIAMGTHGRTGLTRLLMGSVAENVLPKANCPVLIVKAGQSISAPTSDRSAEQVLSAH
jgi:nucleotide-binding universal stress UspA family protein